MQFEYVGLQWVNDLQHHSGSYSCRSIGRVYDFLLVSSIVGYISILYLFSDINTYLPKY